MSDLEFAISKCKQFEQILKTRFGANGRGLHEQVKSIEDLLPPSIAKNLRFIAFVRNRYVHELCEPSKPERFREACESAEHDFEVLLNLYTPRFTRVDLLARELGLKSAELLDRIRGWGLPAKNDLRAILSPAMADQITQLLAATAPSAEQAAPVEPGRQTSPERSIISSAPAPINPPPPALGPPPVQEATQPTANIVPCNSIRIHELAKELELKSQELLDRIPEWKLPVKASPLASLDPSMVDRIKQLLADDFLRSGSDRYAKKEYELALRDLDQAIRLNPMLVAAWSRRAAVWLARHESDRAIADCDQAIRIDATYALAYNNRAAALIATEDFTRAFADCEEAIRLDRSLAIVYVNRGLIRSAREQVEEAFCDFETAIELDPTLAMAYTARGAVLAEKGAYDQAITALDQAIRLDPTDTVTYLQRGIVWQDKGDHDRAIIDFDEAIRLDPNGVGR